MRYAALAAGLAFLAACSGSSEAPELSDNGEPESAIIYTASAVLTVEPNAETPSAVAVRDGRILAVGNADELREALPGAAVDETFASKVIAPGFIDPHIHMDLSSIQYATPMAAPWDMATADGMVAGHTTRLSFMQQVADIVRASPEDEPVIVYGFHNLVHGDLTRKDLDAITTDRPLIIWHYSSHDWYFNTAALAWADVTPELHETYEGVDLDDNGNLTGRIYEDAIAHIFPKVGPILFSPTRLEIGTANFSQLLRAGGVTTVADLGYGIFPRAVADANITNNWVSAEHSGYRLYLVPEHRAFAREFGDDAPRQILAMSRGEAPAPAPVLPQVKFFTDAAFYSQTMRLSQPGYLEGQSEGTAGLWVTHPNDLAAAIWPYWKEGLGIRIHSNGDQAQTATLTALADLRETKPNLRFVIEHAGLFSPQQVSDAAGLGAAISAASHYVYYMGEIYAGPLGPERAGWISPLGSLADAGVPVTVHSDAPLAPPLPLRAAGVHMTRATREGGTYQLGEALSPMEALEAITIDAAYALGLEDELGSIAPGKIADFTILEANPLETPGAEWENIGIWGVVLGGEKRPLE